MQEEQENTFHFEVFIDKGEQLGTQTLRSYKLLREAVKLKEIVPDSKVELWKNDKPLYLFKGPVEDYVTKLDEFLLNCAELGTQDREYIIEVMAFPIKAQRLAIVHSSPETLETYFIDCAFDKHEFVLGTYGNIQEDEEHNETQLENVREIVSRLGINYESYTDNLKIDYIPDADDSNLVVVVPNTF